MQRKYFGFPKILAVIDTYDNLIWDKVGEWQTTHTLSLKRLERGFYYFDPKTVYVFAENICDFFETMWLS